jgi:NAD-dependent deacetylase
MRSQSDLLIQKIAEAGRVVAFTGAGISTECGIPDFRSNDSAWKRHPPIPYDEFMSSQAARAEAWRRKFTMDDLYAGAQPGRAHRALSSLAAQGYVTHVITQNIDGLHQASGIPDELVIELHGNGTYAKCLACGVRHELSRIRPKFEETGQPPVCLCGGYVKGATIAFGQAMPKEPMRQAQKATLACDLFLAIGTSLVVYPAAAFPMLAKDNGAQLVIINRDPTPLDHAADLVLRCEIGDVFEPLISGLQT